MMLQPTPRTERAVEMKRLVTRIALGFPVPLAAMLPPIATAATPLRSAANPAKPTREPRFSETLSEPKNVRCTVTVAGYYSITVPCA
jgi:hypothetical protein